MEKMEKLRLVWNFKKEYLYYDYALISNIGQVNYVAKKRTFIKQMAFNNQN